MRFDSRQRQIFILLVLIALVAFTLFIPPNAVASKNLSMVRMFQPDEAEVLPSVINMIAPAKGLIQALHSFVFYGYYFYGFPYFAASAVVLLPLRLAGKLDDIPLAMVILRQVVSVLPMIAALLILVFMQDGFRSYRSPILFVFLLSVPAVVQNNLWWHPDGITFLFVALTLFFLKRDNLRLGRNFILAAVMCGIATATKIIGVYFFLAVGLVLFLSLILKKTSWKKVVSMGLAYLLIMGLAFVIANPFLISHWARTAYVNILSKQTALLSEGFGVIYSKGLAAAWPLLHASYGEICFLIVALGAVILGTIHGPQRLLHGLILAWFIPITVVVLWVTLFKFQYWLPVALPLFSSLVIMLPEKWQVKDTKAPFRIKQWVDFSIRIILIVVVLVQFVLFLITDFNLYSSDLHRADIKYPRILFYTQALNALTPISQESVKVYYDYRLYAPPTPGWTIETTYDLLDYGYIDKGNFSVLLLLEQRIRDYLNPNVEGIDTAAFAENQRFYRDAENGTINGYELVYRNSIGLVYVQEDLFQKYFRK